MIVMDFIEDGVVVVGREATTEELAEREQVQDNALALAKAEEGKVLAAKSAMDKLLKLGLTREEIIALTGGI
jgi:hypothetical protein